MEDHYDGVLLLINLLLGVSIERERRDEQSCPFLGSTGCRLAARDHVCVNYLCLKIRDRLSPSAVAGRARRKVTSRPLDDSSRTVSWTPLLLLDASNSARSSVPRRSTK